MCRYLVIYGAPDTAPKKSRLLCILSPIPKVWETGGSHKNPPLMKGSLGKRSGTTHVSKRTEESSFPYIRVILIGWDVIKHKYGIHVPNVCMYVLMFPHSLSHSCR